MPAWLKTEHPGLNKNITGQKLSNANQRFKAVKLHCTESWLMRLEDYAEGTSKYL